MALPVRTIVVPIAVATAVGFLLGLMNGAIVARGGVPMASTNLALTSMCAGAVAFAIMTLVRGNRAQASADDGARLQALQFAVAPTAAAIYVFRDGFYGRFLGLDVALNGHAIGQTRGGTFFRIDVAPGRHTLSAYNPQDKASTELPLDLAGGQLAYVELKLRASGKPSRHILIPTDAAAAQPRIRGCRMLAAATPSAAVA